MNRRKFPLTISTGRFTKSVTVYKKTREIITYNGCTSYEDYRELLEKGRDIDANKIITPDHLHTHVSIHSMNKSRHVITHKPM